MKTNAGRRFLWLMQVGKVAVAPHIVVQAKLPGPVLVPGSLEPIHFQGLISNSLQLTVETRLQV